MSNHRNNSTSGAHPATGYDHFLSGEAAALRARAQNLQRLAAEIRASPVMELLGFADLHTWNSPRAEASRHQLSLQIAATQLATEELDMIARRLEEQARDIEYAIAQQAAALGAAGLNTTPHGLASPNPARLHW